MLLIWTTIFELCEHRSLYIVCVFKTNVDLVTLIYVNYVCINFLSEYSFSSIHVSLKFACKYIHIYTYTHGHRMSLWRLPGHINCPSIMVVENLFITSNKYQNKDIIVSTIRKDFIILPYIIQYDNQWVYLFTFIAVAYHLELKKNLLSNKQSLNSDNFEEIRLSICKKDRKKNSGPVLVAATMNYAFVCPISNIDVHRTKTKQIGQLPLGICTMSKCKDTWCSPQSSFNFYTWSIQVHYGAYI